MRKALKWLFSWRVVNLGTSPVVYKITAKQIGQIETLLCNEFDQAMTECGIQKKARRLIISVALQRFEGLLVRAKAEKENVA